MAEPKKCGYRYLGRSGLKVSTLCLGTMTFGQSVGRTLPGQATEEEAHAILDRFAEFGGNFIDSADVYNGGLSEEILGSWLAKRNRDDFVISTKCRFPTGPGVNDHGLSRKHIRLGVEASLKRLKTDYIDVLILHGWDDGTPLEETLGALNDLVRSGKVLYIGFSNVVGWQLQKIADVNHRLGYDPVVCLQAQYSLLCRQTEWELQDVCRREGIALLPWSPLKGGLLTGKVNRDVQKPPPGSRIAWVDEDKSRKNQACPSVEQYGQEPLWSLLDTMKAVGEGSKHSIPQIAIKWLLHQAAVSSVVIGAKNIQQLEENLGAGDKDWLLSDEQVQQLNDASAVPVPYPYEMVWRIQGGRKPDPKSSNFQF